MKDYTDINIIYDISLSMLKIRKESEEGFNTWLYQQRNAEGDAKISLTTFNHFFYPIYHGIGVKQAPDLVLRPSGNTALYDAVGKTIRSIGYRLDALPEDEKPNKVLVVICTDGEDNCSKLYNRDDIQEMISLQRVKYSWEFVFLGTNIDAEETAVSLGIPKFSALNYVGNDVGVSSAYASLSTQTLAYRAADKPPYYFFDWEDRKKQTTAGGVFSDPV